MKTVLEHLNAALLEALAADGNVILLGEDILDPYGGAFKVTRGCSDGFPGRVIPTPISEAGIVGVAAGMALRGLRPVLEIMFGDFLTLAADQIVNHAAKFRWMYNDQVRVPLVIRTPMGGRRGYGPTHSQTLEKHFLGVPGLRVLAPCALGSPGRLLKTAILSTEDPLLFVENKLLYLQPVRNGQELAEFNISTTSLTHRASASEKASGPAEYEDPVPGEAFTLTLRDAPPPVLTLTAYGYMAELARQALLRLAYEQEIFTELVVVTQLSPFEIGPILASASRTGRILTLEEGGLTLGWGAEILALLSAALGPRLQAASRLAACDLPIPASGPLEAELLPGIEAIIQAIHRAIRKNSSYE